MATLGRRSFRMVDLKITEGHSGVGAKEGAGSHDGWDDVSLPSCSAGEMGLEVDAISVSFEEKRGPLSSNVSNSK